MQIHCPGTQGTHLRVSGNGINTEIVTGGGATSEQISGISNPEGFATWRVYSRSSTGIEADRGLHGKTNSQSFIVTNTWNSQLRVYQSRLTLNTSPNGSLRSWTAAVTSSFSRQVFSHGSGPTTSYRTLVRSSSGSVLFDQSSGVSPFTVSVLQCGCNNDDCQRGAFPTDFCCTNCAQQSGILSSILGALRQ